MMLLALLLAFAEPPRVTVSRETTYLTGPLKADGTVDYLAWANAPLKEIKPEDNAAMWLARAVGPSAADKEIRAKYFQLLGINPPPDEGVYLLGLFQMEGYPAHPEEQGRVIDRSLRLEQTPWRAAEAPLFVEWLRRNERPLKLVAEASRRKKYLDPIVWKGPSDALVSSSRLPGGLRDATEMLTIRAMQHVGEGRTAAATADLDVIYRLSSLFARGRGEFLAGMPAAAARNKALRAEVVVAVHGKLTPAALRQRAARLMQLESAEVMIDPASPFERTAAVTMVWGWLHEVLNAGNSGKPKEPPASVIEEVLRAANQWRERFDSAFHSPSPGREAKLAVLENELKDAKKKAEEREASGRKADAATEAREIMEDALLLQVGSGQVALGVRKHMTTMQRQTVLAYLLRAYHAERGAYPDRLDAGMLGAAAEVVVDPCTGKPFVYHVEKGLVRLMSPGRDGEFASPPGKRGSDDIVLELP